MDNLEPGDLIKFTSVLSDHFTIDKVYKITKIDGSVYVIDNDGDNTPISTSKYIVYRSKQQFNDEMKEIIEGIC